MCYFFVIYPDVANRQQLVDDLSIATGFIENQRHDTYMICKKYEDIGAYLPVYKAYYHSRYL